MLAAGSPLARLVFAVLVLACFGAFFVTQRLKHTPTAVQSFHMNTFFSPTAKSGRHSVEHISFKIRQTDRVTVTVVNSAGDDVRTLLSGASVHRYTPKELYWNGRTDGGQLAPDGLYQVRVHLLGQGRSVLSPPSKAFRLDTVPPRPRITAVVPQSGPAPTGGAPPILPLPGGGGVTISFTPDAGGNPHDTDGGVNPQLLLYRTDTTPAQLERTLPIVPGTHTGSWDGTVNGQAAPAGTYLIAIRSNDRAGNVASSPATLPPVALPGRPLDEHAGVTVRYLGAQPPSVPAAANSTTAIGVDARQQPYRWAIQRVGSSRPRAQGSATRPILTLRAPGGVSGLYYVGLSTRSASTAVPLAVQDNIHAGVLVVLPAITWLGTDAVDDNGDGVPETLTDGRPIPRERIFSAGLPAGVASQIAPVLAFLDHARLRYDVTTDVALAAAPQSVLAGHTGVLLPGDERWLPAGAGAALASFVRAGGRLASLGTDTLRATVALSNATLADPSPLGATDMLGARLGPISSSSAISIAEDSINLFNGGIGRFTGYGAYEPTQYVGPQAKLLASAVAASGQAVVVAARLGRGTWVRTGLPALPTRLTSDPNAAALMQRMWALLSGH